MAPIFEYVAYTPAGKSQKGNVDADSAKSARMKLKKQGLIVTEVREKVAGVHSGSAMSRFSGRIGAADVTQATRQLASLVKANVPLVEALNALVEQVENDRLKVILAQVRQDVNEGSSLAKALGQHPKAFDHIFVNMVEAGESSGTLGLVLIRLAGLKEAQLRLANKIISAMSYPALMLCFGMVVMVVIFTFVVPQLAEILVSSGMKLPMQTKVILAVSEFFVSYWWLLLGSAIGGVFAFLSYIKTPRGHDWFDRVKLKAPLFGPMFRMIYITRFANTLSTLLGSGVPIITCMNIAKNLVGNVHIERAIEMAKENISEGQSIGEPLRKSGEFPPLVIHMIAIGEKTGELPQMLQNVASNYEEQVDSQIGRLTSMLEPIMILVMGVFVGIIVVSIFMPMMDMAGSLTRK